MNIWNRLKIWIENVIVGQRRTDAEIEAEIRLALDPDWEDEEDEIEVRQPKDLREFDAELDRIAKHFGTPRTIVIEVPGRGWDDEGGGKAA